MPNIGAKEELAREIFGLAIAAPTEEDPITDTCRDTSNDLASQNSSSANSEPIIPSPITKLGSDVQSFCLGINYKPMLKPYPA